MKNKIVKVVLSGVAVAAISATMVAGLAGCGGVSGEISIDGSTSVEPLMKKLAAAYEEENEDVTINIVGNGSGTGISDASAGKVDIGMSSRALKDSEKTDGFENKTIANDGIAVIVNSASTVTNATKAQLKALYSEGTAFDGIVAGISREDGSGTRSAFNELLGIETLFSGTGFDAVNSTNTVISSIAGNSAGNTVGYISMGSLPSATGCKAIKVEGVEATTDNVKNGSYAISRPFVICYKTEKYTGATKDFIDFIMSEDGQKIITDNGYISIS